MKLSANGRYDFRADFDLYEFYNFFSSPVYALDEKLIVPNYNSYHQKAIISSSTTFFVKKNNLNGATSFIIGM